MQKLSTYWRWVLVALFCVGFLVIIWLNRPVTILATETVRPPLLAFYYGWYDDQTWTSGLVPHQPLITYRSTDPVTIARHVSEARRAGLDGFVMSWYGPQVEYNQTEPNFALLLDEAQRQSFTAAVDFETQSPFFPDQASVVTGLKYLLNTHTQHPAYFRFNGKPVVFFWQQNRFTVEEWESIRQEVDPNHTSLWIAEGVNLSYQFHFDGHHLYNISWASDVSATLTRWRDLVRYFASFYNLERYWVATTMPGFDERHLGRPNRNYRVRGTGEFYKESWAAAMATEPDMLVITSFNEWVEDSQIEPDIAYGDYFLDLTYALRTGGSLPATPVLPTPLPTSTPGTGSIVGILTEATSGDRLADVTLSVAGQTMVSSASGYYRFDNVIKGIQTITAQKMGYLTVEQARIVAPGQVVWNSIAMLPGVDSTVTATVLASPTATPGASVTVTTTPLPTNMPLPTDTPLSSTATPIPQIGTLLGLITNIESGRTIADVQISADGQMVTTNANGVYILENLPVGLHEVLAQHPNFEPTTKSRTVLAGTKRWNSFAMQPIATPTPNHTATLRPINTPLPTDIPSPTATPQPTATASPIPQPTNTTTSGETATPQPGVLVGVITNADTGERVIGAQVSANGQTVDSNSNGIYYFAALSPGNHQVTVEHSGFLPTTKTGFVVSTQTRWNSIALMPETTATATATPQAPAPATATSIATILPSATAQPTITSSPTATATPETGTLTGIIIETGTGQELENVRVSVADRTTITDQNGVYQFDNLLAGWYTITAEKEGYETNQIEEVVEAGETVLTSVELTPLLGYCPTQSKAEFTLIPIDSSPTDRPDYLHGDLNFALRGFSRTTAHTGLINYSGSTAVNAPQLAGLFKPAEFPGISSVYRANHWDWGCGEHGCRGEVIFDWPVTVVGLTTTPGKRIHIPQRGPQIYSGGFKAMVLYAEENRITLGYTRDDSVAFGYAIHLENICVDANLLALYQAQNDANGYRSTGFLPALHEEEFFAIALDTEIQVAIRDRGTFLDPRSRKDWWQGY